MRERTNNDKSSAVIADRTHDLELAAALTTLGFECLGMQRFRSADLGEAEATPEGCCYWRFATVSEDGRYTLEQVLKAWQNDAWLTDPATTDPLAHIIVAFRNRHRLLDWCKQSKAMVAIKTGARWAFVPENADTSTLARAKNFLTGKA
jgi:hypothetical protein